jgi:RNA polymerase subunit RPABC4/transcription elongation factor Spt4
MIFIAGISPKTKVLDQNPRRCPICGLHQAYFKRVDHFLSLFFIPLLRIKKGDPFVMCDRCEKAIPDFDPDISTQPGHGKKNCLSCNRFLDQDFTYCPYCGKRI